MVRLFGRWLGVTVSVITVMATTTASAQVLGSFRWRLAPFCNVVTLTVEQRGSVFLLTGYDDRCGQPVRAAVDGTALLNLDGTASLGFETIRPDGRAIHTTVVLNLATINGTWSDNYANTGTFTFNPAVVAGSPRSITIRGVYGVNYQAAAAGDNGLSPFSFGETLAAAPTAVAANFIFEGGAPTANCPGTPALPQAAAGHLCVYEERNVNVQADRCIVRLGTGFSCNIADRYGAAIFTQATAAGGAQSQGSWAVTIVP